MNDAEHISEPINSAPYGGMVRGPCRNPVRRHNELMRRAGLEVERVGQTTSASRDFLRAGITKTAQYRWNPVLVIASNNIRRILRTQSLVHLDSMFSIVLGFCRELLKSGISDRNRSYTYRDMRLKQL